MRTFSFACFGVVRSSNTLDESGLLQFHNGENQLDRLYEQFQQHEVSQPPVLIPEPDFSGKAEMPRKFVETYPQEFFVSIPMQENAITKETVPIGPGMEMSYAVIPSDHHFVNMKAQRSTHVGDDTSEEFGEMRWIGDVQDPKMAAVKGAVYGWAERFHVYRHEPPWPVTEAVPNDGTELQDPSDDAINAINRSSKVFQFIAATRWQTMLLAGSYDPLAMLDLKTHLTSADGRTPTTSDWDKLASIRVRMLESEKETPLDAEPSSVVTSCLHLMEHPLIIRNSTTLKVPLGYSLPSLRAQTVFSPTYHFSAVFGKTFFSINNGQLEAYSGAMTYADWNIKRENMGTESASMKFRSQPRLFVTSPGGDGLPSMQVQHLDLRATQHGLMSGDLFTRFQTDDIDPSFNYLFKQYALMPMSHSFLFQDMEESCPQHVLEQLASEVQSSDWMELQHEGLSGLHQFTHGMLGALPCGKHFLRGAADFGNGLDILEMVVWSHFLMEWTPERRMHAVRGHENLADGWHWKKMGSN